MCVASRQRVVFVRFFRRLFDRRWVMPLKQPNAFLRSAEGFAVFLHPRAFSQRISEKAWILVCACASAFWSISM